MATNKQPANTLRCGNIKATIWQIVSEKGPFFSTTLRPCSPWRMTPRIGLPLMF